MKKIIVHDGILHADDVLSVALIHRFLGVVEVERKRTITPEEIDDPDVWVVDVGRQYDPEKSCFDHHQDGGLPASCLLVLNRLHDLKVIRNSEGVDVGWEFYEEIKEQILSISEIDCKGSKEFNGFQVSSLISGYNSFLNGFDMAVKVMRDLIEMTLFTIEEAKESLALWEKAEYVMVGDDIVQGIKICTAYPIKWKEYEGAKFLIVPEKGDWKLLSKDSALYPIATNGKEKFLHAGKFIAVFLTKEDAIASAINSVNIKTHI